MGICYSLTKMQGEREAGWMRQVAHLSEPVPGRWIAAGVVGMAVVMWIVMPRVVFAVSLPVLLWGVANVVWGGTEVRLEGGRVRWRDMAFPVRRPRQVKLEDVECWVMGEVPGKTDPKKGKVASYWTGLRRIHGKVMVIHQGFRLRSEAEQLAVELGQRTGRRVEEHSLLRSKRVSPEWAVWAKLAAILLVFAVIAMLVIGSAESR